MTEENENKLFEKYPTVYLRDDDGQGASTLCYGIETGDGWFDLIAELSAKIEERNVSTPGPNCTALQVKEKFGTLRFYVDTDADTVYDWINEAEAKSKVTCESCGAPGVLGGTGWYLTLCEPCLATQNRLVVAPEA